MSKTYTLTWYRPFSWRKNGICRCRFEAGSYYWLTPRDFGAVGAFLALMTLDRYPFDDRNFRLIKAGRLVARAATYQGV